jgi:hypothetical protein
MAGIDPCRLYFVTGIKPEKMKKCNPKHGIAGYSELL